MLLIRPKIKNKEGKMRLLEQLKIAFNNSELQVTKLDFFKQLQRDRIKKKTINCLFEQIKENILIDLTFIKQQDKVIQHDDYQVQQKTTFNYMFYEQHKPTDLKYQDLRSQVSCFTFFFSLNSHRWD